uniref:Putative F0 sector of membrane-bound ATP synthase, subunit b AtpF n=1 Tax=mine drainage metagenome TaxID=410659 RepID=E6QHR4_9ZZZZ
MSLLSIGITSRFSFSRYFSSSVRLRLLLAGLLFGCVVSGFAPAALLAQQVPAGRSYGVARMGKLAPDQAQPAKAEQDTPGGNDVYLHSATVRWIAHAFHASTETAARTFEWINFAILALAIVIPLARILPRVMRRRAEALREQLESARTATADANTRLTAVEQRLSGLDTEIAAIRHQVESEMQQDEAHYKTNLQEETARIVASAEQEIVVAAAQAQRELKQYAAGLAIDKALAEITLSSEQESALIADFARNSGTNGTGGANGAGGRN